MDKLAKFIAQAQLIWSKWWFILHKHNYLIKTVRSFQRSDQNGDSLHKHSYLIKMVHSVQQSDQNGDSLHKHSYLIKMVRAVQRLFLHSLQLSSFLSTTMAECLQSSSMLHPNPLQWIAPIPPTTKPSKQGIHGNCKPITRNALTWSSLFFLCSSSPSLRLGHHCCHCGSLHSRVSCV